MNLTIIVPTFNEAPNVEELVTRIEAAVGPSSSSEIIFVDDSTDDTPQVILGVAAAHDIPVRLIHRDHPVGGLSGAVIEGLGASSREWCLVMDGDLQHPPELIPSLIQTGIQTDADVVVASRHAPGGSNSGLSSGTRRFVSMSTTALTRGMFPVRLRNCTDPMTGFFAVRRDRIAVENLQPRGFKILLEILARQPLRVVEEPFLFGERKAGKSKAGMAQGLRFLRQLAALRFGRLSKFAVIGAFGAVLNIAIVALLLRVGTYYLLAAIVAAVVTILINFVLQERFVFHDLRNEGRSVWHRLAQSLAFNGTDAAVRVPVLYVIVQFTPIHPLIAQVLTLAVSFVARFLFQSRVVYRPRRTTPVSPMLAEAELPETLAQPELDN